MAPRSLTFYAIRHGERLDKVKKDWVADPRYIIPDTLLTEHGRSQAVQTGSYLSTMLEPAHRVIIYTSPFKRCVETALGIAQGLSGVNTNCKDIYDSASPSREKTLDTLPTLRLEPGLGEWLLTRYFKDIPTIPTPQQMRSWRIDELDRNSSELGKYCSIDWNYEAICNRWVFPESDEELDNRWKDTKDGIEKAIKKEEGDVVVIFVTHESGVNWMVNRSKRIKTGYCCLSRIKWVEGTASDEFAGNWNPPVDMDDDEAWSNENHLSDQMNRAKNGCGGGEWVVDIEASVAHLEGMKLEY